MSDRSFSDFLNQHHAFREELVSQLFYSGYILKAGIKLCAKWPKNPNFTWDMLNQNQNGGSAGAGRFVMDCMACGATCQDMYKAVYGAGLELLAIKMLQLAGVSIPNNMDIMAPTAPLIVSKPTSAPAAVMNTGNFDTNMEMIDLDEEIVPMHDYLVLADMGHATEVVPTSAIKTEAKGRAGLQKIVKIPKYADREVGLYTQLSCNKAEERDAELQDNATVIDLSDEEDDASKHGVRQIQLKKGAKLLGTHGSKVTVTIGGVKREIKKGSSMSGLMIIKRSAVTVGGRRDHKYEVVMPDEPITEEEGYFELSDILAGSDKGSEYAVFLLVTSNKQATPTVSSTIRAHIVQPKGNKSAQRPNIASNKIRDNSSMEDEEDDAKGKSRKSPPKASGKKA